MVATFIDSFLALTFLADRPALYWMLFHPRQVPLPRITEIPSCPSTTCFRSMASDMAFPPCQGIVGQEAQTRDLRDSRDSRDVRSSLSLSSLLSLLSLVGVLPLAYPAFFSAR